jgi:hypothetical protein
VKNKPDSQKNTDALGWKPASKVKLEADPNSIASWTRLRSAQNVVSDNAVPTRNLNFGAMSCVKSEEKYSKSPSSIQTDQKL